MVTTTAAPRLRAFWSGRHRAERARAVAGYAMSAPALIALTVFVLVPFLVAIGLSLYNISLSSARDPQFVGLDQYKRILFDPQLGQTLRGALRNNAVFAAVVVPLQTGLALALALFLNRRLPGLKFFRTFFFMPTVFPIALVAIVWRIIYSRGDTGLLNAALSAVTFGRFEAHDWLGSPATAMLSIIVLSVWQGVGFQMIIVLAGLQSIPPALYEAAEMDGASRRQQFWYVVLPSLRTTLIFVTTVTTILAFRMFDQVYVLVRGGGANEESTRTVIYEAVTTAFEGQGNVGRASAITIVFFVVVLTLTLLQRAILNSRSDR